MHSWGGALSLSTQDLIACKKKHTLNNIDYSTIKKGHKGPAEHILQFETVKDTKILKEHMQDWIRRS